MNVNEYQRLAMRTSTDDCDLINVAFGLAGETGEVIDLIKKHIYQGHDLSKQDLKLELGDICWYVALACKLSGLTLSQVLQANIDKLVKRYPNGFTADDSVGRKL